MNPGELKGWGRFCHLVYPSGFHNLRVKMLIVIWAAMIILLPVGGGLWADSEQIYEMPVAEADDVLTGWLDNSGFNIYRPSTSPGETVLLVEKGQQQLRITARRSSPLAARIRIEVLQGPAQSSAIQLEQYLQGYIQLPNRTSLPSQPSTPNVIRGYGDAVVCIYAIDHGREIQLTGFAVDIDGMIVCTGHDLSMGQVVDMLLHDGREIVGTVVKIDRQRDLALIQASQAFDVVISLRNGRFMLNDGDTLFAISCTNGGMADILNGFLDGPPRRVSGLPLWQVRMHIDPGSSGSPVFDDRGRLAAIVKGRFRGTDAIGFFIPFETLLHFLGRY